MMFKHPIIYLTFLYFTLVQSQNLYKDQPKILSQNGHLTFIAAREKNITFRTELGSIHLNGKDLLLTMEEASNASRFLARYVMNFGGITRRITNIESRITSLTSSSPDANSNLNLINSTDINLKFRIINQRYRSLRRAHNLIARTLMTNECLSSPCKNGGTCIDLYLKVFCICPPQWQGSFCDQDINECELFAGTDLGCQNGATCRNTIGSYQCLCKSNWFGVHCTKKSGDCSTGGRELCGHGICVQDNNDKGYNCICDQGWTKDQTTPACTVDVNECTMNKPPCSINPLVSCFNTPGSFRCGQCPIGYSGNGHYCTDVDECSYNNGGCSPMVQCINTMGSRICGQCPAGYVGNGETCSFKGVCNVNNGGCHHLAQCRSNSAISANFVECICPPGFTGTGIGPNGCISLHYELHPCRSNPCVNGICSVNNITNNYVCKCNTYYSGRNCDILMNPCASSPCLNGGTCIVRSRTLYRCKCSKGYVGQNCENEGQVCGGRLVAESGVLKYPPDDYSSNINKQISCAWVISTTNSMKVLRINFTKFDLNACSYSFLQIHDGKNSAAHPIGRFCDKKLPSNGTIISTHNVIYLWFRSSFLPTNGGFQLNWTSTDPYCSSTTYVKSHGSIQSPGYPGFYPPNRDCYWQLVAPLGKRLLFQFYALDLGNNPNCDYDYVEFITGGISSNENVFAKFCNTSKESQPSPIYSVGPEVLIHFHSDAKKSYSGFLTTYSIVEGIPGCGGTYQISQGEIQSPSVNDRYLPKLFCEYKIVQLKKMRIKLTFLWFDLEQSTNCKFDHVAVYEGASLDAPLVGRYCGKDLPAPYTSTGNELTILFKTDVTDFGKGFKIKFETVCGGKYTEPEGILMSPGYPNSYPNSISCVFEIVQPTGKAILLNFIDFDMKNSAPSACDLSYIEIRDGDNENSTLIGKYCDKSNLPEVILSKYNYMWIKFTNENIFKAVKKFKANYTSVDIKCGGILKEFVGTLSTPNQVGLAEYSSGIKCEWILSAPPGYVVQITWMTFRLELSINCTYDSVQIYDNNTDTNMGGLMGRFCGSKLPPTLLSSSNLVTIIFSTDATITSDGFVASYTFVQEKNVCGGNYFTSSGYIKTPNYPEKYPKNIICTWTITVAPGSQIMLDIIDFELEFYSNCRYDWLEIRNGGTSMSPIIGQYCGTTIPKQIPSQSNKIYLQFNSDLSKNEKGFKIKWSSTATGCGGTVTSPSGSIISPHYPEPYNQNTECYWKIAVSPGSRIQLIFADLDLEKQGLCGLDYVEIYDGPKGNSKSLGRFCESNSGKVILSSTNHVFIKFHSDVSIQGRGFHLQYLTNCTNTLTDFGGIIESPNFPNGYTQDQKCVWDLIVPPKNKIKLIFSHFELERVLSHVENKSCVYDYVEISYAIENDEFEEEFKKYGTYCGYNSPGVITLDSNHVKVKFVTDQLLFGPGFRFEWMLEGCGGLLTHPKGEIMSPNYPKSYPPSVQCNWKIQVEYGKSIQITFSDLDIETNGNCAYDSINIYNGPDSNYNLLSSLCQLQKEISVTSSGNYMFIVFQADSSYSGKGFKATYNTTDTKCGGQFANRHGFIYSPNYPKNYNRNDTCEYLLKVDENHVIQLKFNDVDLVENDYVKVFDGPTQAYPLLKEVHNNTNETITSSYNLMLVEFRSKSLFTSKGFKATYKKGCGINIKTQSSGVIQYEDYNNIDLDIENCNYTISAINPSNHISLTISSMNFDSISCETQVYPVQIFNGDSDKAPLLEKYCSSKIPPTIVSDGSSIHIDLAAPKYFYATYSVFDSHCGGTLTALQGYISSPGYPKSIPPNRVCEWTVQAAKGNSLTFAFLNFNLPESDSCNTDFLEIRQSNSSGKLLGVFCGSNKPAANITNKESLWIMLKTSNITVTDEDFIASSSKGFYLEYTLSMENRLYGPSGVIQSPLYPQFTFTDEIYTWTIVVKRFRAVLITFTDFYVDIYYNEDNCYFSYVEVFDGVSSDAPLLGSYCGLIPPQPIKTTSNIAFIKVHFTTHYKGILFSLKWSETYNNMFAFSTALSTNVSCGGEIDLTNLHNYTLTSPGYPSGYENNLNCTWIFTTTPMNHLEIYFASVHLYNFVTGFCLEDYITLYEKKNTDTDWRFVKKLCKAHYNDSARLSSTMRVSFITNSRNNDTGFKAYIRENCGGSLIEPSGYIILSKLTRNFNCQWNVTVRAGRTIMITFLNINIPSSSQTTCNSYVLLRNGKSANSPILGKYCGTALPKTLQTTGNNLFVKYKGNINGVFTIKYEEVAYLCNKNIRLANFDNVTEIWSPNYPNIPPTHIECKWSVRAPLGETLRIDFEERFDLTASNNCEKEYVEVRNGGTEYSPLLGRFCSDIPSTQYSTDNMLFIKYFTDLDEPRNGFKAAILINTCGGTYRGKEGQISSPVLNQVLNCTWNIVSPENYLLKLKFKKFDIAPKNVNCTTTNRLEIIEQFPLNITASSNVRTFCDTIPDEISLSTNRVVLKLLVTSVAKAVEGFILEYSSSYEDCGGLLNTESGEITSPGYPLIFPRSCHWKIEVPFGRRITLEILDFDLDDPESVRDQGFGYAKGFGIRPGVNIVKPKQLRESKNIIESSENKMSLYYWSSFYSNHRGIKANYSSNRPSLCVGDLSQDTGSIREPENTTDYVCTYEHSTGKTDQTVAYKIIYLNTIRKQNINCAYVLGSIIISSGNTLAKICEKTRNPYIVRSPYPTTVIKVMSTLNTGVKYNISYETFKCGGIITNVMGVISTPNYPNRYNGYLECAWVIKLSADNTVKINFTSVQLDNECEKSYIIVYNGDLPTKPRIGQYCGQTLPTNIIQSQYNSLLIEYKQSFDSNSKGFSLNYEEVQNGCGGIFHDNSRVIQTPNYDKDYPNNAECLWDIVSANGYYINFSFIGRFQIEETKNCTKDYVEVYDWRDDNWFLINRLCGRQVENNFNSTSNKMRILFKSDGNITGSGFKAEWNFKCGGLFKATQLPQKIVSPGYPDSYSERLTCVYKIVRTNNNNDIEIKFDDFDIEQIPSCRFDNLTITTFTGRPSFYWPSRMSNRFADVLCGDTIPPTRYYTSNVVLTFKTDAWLNRKGFSLTYKLDGCNNTVTNETSIEFVPRSRTYDRSRLITRITTCHWYISAPPNNIVILSLETLDTRPLSLQPCVGQSLNVYDGFKAIIEKRLAVLCGYLNSSVIHSSSNEMLVKFRGRNYYNKFKANIMFAPDWCGKDIALQGTSTQVITISQKRKFNCIWTLSSQMDNYMEITFNGFDLLRNCSTTIQNNTNCDCGFIEIRDGLSFSSELIEYLCINSNVNLLKLRTTADKAYIRVFLDVEIKTPINIMVAPKLSNCGHLILNATKEVQYLSSPNYPGQYPQFTRCRWLIKSSKNNKLRIDFKEIDLLDEDNSNSCNSDRLEIEEENGGINRESLGPETVISRNKKKALTFYSADSNKHVYCGKTNKTTEFFSDKTNVEVLFISEESKNRGKGFLLEYSAIGCHNYTREQGRLYQTNLKDECSFFIEVPQNRTISLYFRRFYTRISSNCETEGIEVHENNSSGNLLLKACGFRQPNPIFSTTNRLWIRTYSHRQFRIGIYRYDIIYTSSTAGRGCGGKLFNVAGKFTSPFYPNSYNDSTLCTWDVSVPNNMKIALQFSVFDFQGSCLQNYVTVVTYTSDLTTSHTFCQDDNPALLTSEKRLTVSYQSSSSAQGTGWVAFFKAID